MSTVGALLVKFVQSWGGDCEVGVSEIKSRKGLKKNSNFIAQERCWVEPG